MAAENYQSVAQVNPGYILNQDTNFELKDGRFPRSIAKILASLVHFGVAFAGTGLVLGLVAFVLFYLLGSFIGFLNYLSGSAEWNDVMILWVGLLIGVVIALFKQEEVSEFIGLLKEPYHALKSLKKELYPRKGVLLKAPVREVKIQKGHRGNMPVSLLTIHFEFRTPDDQVFHSVIHKERNISRDGEWTLPSRPWLAVYYWHPNEFEVI